MSTPSRRNELVPSSHVDPLLKFVVDTMWHLIGTVIMLTVTVHLGTLLACHDAKMEADVVLDRLR